MHNPSDDLCFTVLLSTELISAQASDLEDLLEPFLGLPPVVLANYSGTPSVVLCCQFLCYAKRVVTLRRELIRDTACFDRFQAAILKAPAARARKAVEDVSPETA